ncbi:MAG: hypothetical protein QXV73_05185 [Candidatus Micrarchaeia archaeon]
MSAFYKVRTPYGIVDVEIVREVSPYNVWVRALKGCPFDGWITSPFYGGDIKFEHDTYWFSEKLVNKKELIEP